MRDLLTHNDIGELGAAIHLRRGKHESSTVAIGDQRLENRGVEAGRAHREHPRRRGQSEAFSGERRDGGRRAVRDGGALRPAGRTGRENDVGGIVHAHRRDQFVG